MNQMFRHITAALFPTILAIASPIADAAIQIIPAAPADAQAPAIYADYADLIVQSPLILDATIRSASRIRGAEAAGLPPTAQRYYVEADVGALVRGNDAMPARVGWLVDVTRDAAGRFPRLKKQRVIAFARPVAGRASLVQLVAPDAQRPWSPARDELVRRIAREATRADAPPAITGVRSAFHVPGALPGEGETQIFLTTAGDRPAALSIVRKADVPPRWSATFGEVIDPDAAPPAHDTLAWYRLACGLPRALPAEASATLSPEDAGKAQEDYGFALAQLGPCRPGAEAAAQPAAVSTPDLAPEPAGAPVSGGAAPW